MFTNVRLFPAFLLCLALSLSSCHSSSEPGAKQENFRGDAPREASPSTAPLEEKPSDETGSYSKSQRQAIMSFIHLAVANGYSYSDLKSQEGFSLELQYNYWLNRALQAKSDGDLLQAISGFIASFKDGHLMFRPHHTIAQVYTTGVKLQLVEGFCVVTESSLEQVPVKSQVVFLDGKKSCEEMLNEMIPYVSGSTEGQRQMVALGQLTLKTSPENPHPFQAVVVQPGETESKQVEIPWYPLNPGFDQGIYSEDASTLKDLGNGILLWKISSFLADDNLNRLVSQQVAQAAAFKKIIIDVRGNSGGLMDSWTPIIEALGGTEPYFEVRFRVNPFTIGRNPKLIEYYDPNKDFSDWMLYSYTKKNVPKINAEIRVLTDSLCFSSCDQFVAWTKRFPQVKTVGTNTAGGTGSPVWMPLPYDVGEIAISSWQLRYTDSKKFLEGTGTKPDLSVTSSFAGFIQEKDEVLDIAIKDLLLNNKDLTNL